MDVAGQFLIDISNTINWQLNVFDRHVQPWGKLDEWNRRLVSHKEHVASSKRRSRLDTANVNQPKFNSIVYYALPFTHAWENNILRLPRDSGGGRYKYYWNSAGQRDAPQITDVPTFFFPFLFSLSFFFFPPPSFTANYRIRRWRWRTSSIRKSSVVTFKCSIIYETTLNVIARAAVGPRECNLLSNSLRSVR